MLYHQAKFGEDRIQHAPAVGAKIWCLYVSFSVYHAPWLARFSFEGDML